MTTEQYRRIEIIERAAQAVQEWDRPIHIRTDITHLIGMITLLQLALSHPRADEVNEKPIIETMVREMIEDLDPDHGDLYEFLMLGFEPLETELVH